MKRLNNIVCIVLTLLPLLQVAECLSLPGLRGGGGDWRKDLITGYKQRCAADPNFPLKSLTEVVLAAGTQLAAEYESRGADAMVAQVDFVVAGVLTAIYVRPKRSRRQ